MKKIFIVYLISVTFIGCYSSKEKSSETARSNVSAPEKNHETDGTLDSLDFLCQKWQMRNMYIIRDGEKNKFNQVPLTLELKKDYTSVTEIKATNNTVFGEWELNDSFSEFTIKGTSINGEKLDQKIIQENKIVLLNKNELSYQFTDTVLDLTILIEFKRFQ